MTHGEIAKENFYKGYNCSQSIILSFADILPVDEKTALIMVQGFGGGFSRLREVCGTLSGATAVIGLLYGSSDPKDTEAKTKVYSLVREIAERYKQAFGSYICRDLLGLSGESSPVPEKRTDEYYKKRPCPEIIETAANILDEFLNEKKEQENEISCR